MIRTIECPHCKERHALFWIRGGSGRRKLHIVCNHIPTQVHNKDGNPVLTYRTGTVCVHTAALYHLFKNDPLVPEEWSGPWAKKKREERTCELPLNLK